MQLVVGVRFKKAGKIYYFGPNDFDLKVDDHVIVETARGIEYGDVVVPPKMVPDEEIVSPLKPVIRKANEEDERQVIENKKKEEEAFQIGEEKIAAHQLPMNLVDVELTFDNSKLIFYFTADGRIDFRELVKDLASVFKTRIELRQIGVRDEAKMLGGMGPCGLSLCCSTFMGDFHPVSIKMAKEQNLSLNPAKISGLCGRLMCCLKYEQDYYECVRGIMPKAGREVLTPEGPAVVLETNLLTQKVKVKLTSDDGTVDLKEFSVSDLQYGESQNEEEGHQEEENEEIHDEELKNLMED
ncbi:MAG: PSP1 domain-containing protein [Caldicoprobacterales bacterium]|jgi:cell fate regulator YaaT (PSP1 superfamily)|nr:stage 0 sporulation family protein [Clostridiales bacterium]